MRGDDLGVSDALQATLSESFGESCVVVRWALVADVLTADDDRSVVALADGPSVSWESKALVREALGRHLFDADEVDEDE